MAPPIETDTSTPPAPTDGNTQDQPGDAHKPVESPQPDQICGDTSAPTGSFLDELNQIRCQLFPQTVPEPEGPTSQEGNVSDANGQGKNGSDKGSKGKGGQDKDGQDKDSAGQWLGIDWKNLFHDVTPQNTAGGAQRPNPDAIEAYEKLKDAVRERLKKGIKGDFEDAPAEKVDLWDGKTPEESLTPEAVNQGGIPDCFFESALASLVNTDKGKEAVKKMVTANEDGTFTVKFPGAPEAITVTQQEIADSGTTNKAPWSRAIETAFLKYNVDGDSWHSWGAEDGVGPLAKVRTSRDAIGLLTGDSVGTTQFAVTDLGSGRLTLGGTSQENIEHDLKWAMEHQAVVVANASPNFAKWVGGNAPEPLPDQHVYSVLGYDEKTKTVTIRNPWGSNPSPLDEEGATVAGITNAGDGKLTMSLDTFSKQFSDIAVSGRNDAFNTVEHFITDAVSTPKNVLEAGNDLLHGNFGDAAGDLWDAFGSWGHTQQDALNGVTSTLWEYGGHVLSHPEELLIPGLPALHFGFDQAKEIAPLVIEKAGDLVDTAANAGGKIVDAGSTVVNTVVDTGVSVVEAPFKAIGGLFD